MIQIYMYDILALFEFRLSSDCFDPNSRTVLLQMKTTSCWHADWWNRSTTLSTAAPPLLSTLPSSLSLTLYAGWNHVHSTRPPPILTSWFCMLLLLHAIIPCFSEWKLPCFYTFLALLYAYMYMYILQRFKWKMFYTCFLQKYYPDVHSKAALLFPAVLLQTLTSGSHLQICELVVHGLFPTYMYSTCINNHSKRCWERQGNNNNTTERQSNTTQLAWNSHFSKKN